MELVVHITMPDQKHSGLAFTFEEFKMVGMNVLLILFNLDFVESKLNEHISQIKETGLKEFRLKTVKMVPIYC